MARYGVFCLEGRWWGDLRDRASVEPALRMLSDTHPSHFAYIHQRIATEAELAYYLGQWGQRRYAGYPILYLAFHGLKGCLCLKHKNVSLEQLREWVAPCRHRAVIHFGCCKMMGLDARLLRRFMRGSAVVGVSGYTRAIDWYDATAFEIMLLRSMQELSRLTPRSLVGMREGMKQHFSRSRFFADLSFRLLVNRP